MAEPATEAIAPEIIKVTQELSCDLNELDWQNRARELADAQKQAEEMEDRKKTVMSDLNTDVKTAKLKVSKLARVVANKRELREVTVEIKYDYEKGVVTHTRTDTNEEISRRDITTQERQSKLDLLDANALIEARHEEEDEDD
jgi:hypothetical protein